MSRASHPASDDPLMLSVSGLRGLMGRSLTPPLAARYAAALGGWFRRRRQGDATEAGPDDGVLPRILIGRDGRVGGDIIELAVCSGLMAAGCDVTCLGIASTPAVGVMVDHLEADGGVIITASHNPIEWNGIKVLGGDGAAPPAHEAAEIIDRFHNFADRPAPWAGLERLGRRDEDGHAAATHVQRVLEQVEVERVRAARLRVVVDSVCGAGGHEAHALLDALGVELIHMHAEPTGRFPHPPEPTAAHLGELCRAVPAHDAHLGFAQDPDADRLAIVDRHGRYIGEEYTLALAALHVLEHSDNPAAATLAANLSTSRMIDDIAAAAGARVLRTPVGEANVVQAMQREGCILGGEGNGGVIYPPVCLIRDSLTAMAFTLELLAVRGRPLDAIVDSLPRYAIVKDKLDARPDLLDRLPALMEAAFPGQRVDRQDGLRIDLPDGWVHIRPSNTEPIIRIIAEAPDEPAAKGLIEQTRAVLAGGG